MPHTPLWQNAHELARQSWNHSPERPPPMPKTAMTTEEFAAIDKLSVLARLAMNDMKSLPRKEFHPYHARFLSTTDNLNRSADMHPGVPNGRCAVCIAGAVLVRTLNMPTPPPDVEDAYTGFKAPTFSKDPDIERAVKDRIMAIEYMRVGDFPSAFVRIQDRGREKSFSLASGEVFNRRHMGFNGWKKANAFLADWKTMIHNLEAHGL